MSYSRYRRSGSASGIPLPSPLGGTTASAAPARTQCSITWDASCGAYVVATPYDPNFIEFLKAKIPGSQRAWDPVNKTWKVEEQWFDVLRVLATELWGAGAVKVVTKESVDAAVKQQQEAQRAALMAALPQRERSLLEFVEMLTLDALKAAYRKAAVELHPDRNANDGSKMALLNAAWSKLEKELEGKK